MRRRRKPGGDHRATAAPGQPSTSRREKPYRPRQIRNLGASSNPKQSWSNALASARRMRASVGVRVPRTPSETECDLAKLGRARRTGRAHHARPPTARRRLPYGVRAQVGRERRGASKTSRPVHRLGGLVFEAALAFIAGSSCLERMRVAASLVARLGGFEAIDAGRRLVQRRARDAFGEIRSTEAWSLCAKAPATPADADGLERQARSRRAKGTGLFVDGTTHEREALIPSAKGSGPPAKGDTNEREARAPYADARVPRGDAGTHEQEWRSRAAEGSCLFAEAEPVQRQARGLYVEASVLLAYADTNER